MSVTHWGEIPNKTVDSYIPDVTQDIENSMSKFCLAEFDGDEEFSEKLEQIVLSPMDPLMLYAISLHKYANQMADNSQECAEIAMPKMPNLSIRHKKNNLNYVPKDFTDFTTGTEIDVSELSPSIIKQILLKCIATMFAHIGYETSYRSALDVLSDVLDVFLKKITRHFKIALEDEQKGHYSDFPYIIERVLTEIGLGGISGLKDYYQSRVVKYVTVLEDRYTKLNMPKSPSPVDSPNNKIVRVKLEPKDDAQVESAEVLFSTIEGGVSSSILETGYKLLNSLEANYRV